MSYVIFVIVRDRTQQTLLELIGWILRHAIMGSVLVLLRCIVEGLIALNNVVIFKPKRQ